jgi:hypothetical protein
MSTIEELLERKSSGSGSEIREYGCADPLRWPRGALYPWKVALNSLTCGGHSVGIVRSRTQATELLIPFSPLEHIFWHYVFLFIRTSSTPWNRAFGQKMTIGDLLRPMFWCGFHDTSLTDITLINIIVVNKSPSSTHSNVTANIFRVVTACSLIEGFHFFKGTYRLHLQGRKGRKNDFNICHLPIRLAPHHVSEERNFHISWLDDLKPILLLSSYLLFFLYSF